jgi:hypothetical protein
MNVEFQIHGVLAAGQSVWKQDDMDYYQTFYAQRSENVLMTVDTLQRPHGLCTYYNYLRSNNVVSAREGSYFGMSVRIDGAFCIDVRGMYDILDNLFEKMVVGKILLPIEGGRFKFAVDRFEDLSDYLTQLEQNFFGMYSAFFALSDFIQLNGASLPKRYNVNPVDVTPSLVKQLLNQHLKIGVSPEIAPISAQESIRKARVDIERERQQLLASADNCNQELSNLLTEIDRLRQDNQRLTNSTQSSNRDGEINEMLRQIGKPLTRLSKFVGERYPDDVKDDKKDDKQAIGLNTILLLVILAFVIIMNLFGVKSCNNNQLGQQQACAQAVKDTITTTYTQIYENSNTIQNDMEEEIFDEVSKIDFSTAHLNVDPNPPLRVGEGYTLSLTKKGNASQSFLFNGQGEWQYRIGDADPIKLETYESNTAYLPIAENMRGKKILIEFLYKGSAVVNRDLIIQ